MFKRFQQFSLLQLNPQNFLKNLMAFFGVNSKLCFNLQRPTSTGGGVKHVDGVVYVVGTVYGNVEGVVFVVGTVYGNVEGVVFVVGTVYGNVEGVVIVVGRVV
jgi:hypothetical protein